MNDLPLLSAEAMASFAARGFLRFDAAVPEDLNRQFLDEMGDIAPPRPGQKMMRTYGEMLARAGVPQTPAGVPLAQAYPEGSALKRLLDLPLVVPSAAWSARTRSSTTTSCTSPSPPPTTRPAAARTSPSTITRTPPSTPGGPSTSRSCTTRTR